MVGHFVSRYINPDGTWKNQTELYNIAADISPTAGQMPRAVGLAYASVLYRELDELKHLSQFSHNGNEVTFTTIGNASTAEGLFWESVNAIGVLKAPAVVSIYDDGYGISVPNQFQMVKENIGEILRGFERDASQPAEKAERGYDHVIGVANANSTPGFVRKLDFQLVAPLDVRVGMRSPSRGAGGTPGWAREWSADELGWRLDNPARTYAVHEGRRGLTISSPTDRPGVRAVIKVGGDPALEPAARALPRGGRVGPRVWVGLSEQVRHRFPTVELPDRLKPSPLNLIYLPLQGQGDTLDPRRVEFEGIDFDAW